MKKTFLKTEINTFEVSLDRSVAIFEDIKSSLPFSGEAKRIEGEIYYIIDTDIKFDGTEKSKFEIGDIVYWRSQKAERFAIAIFYGNTKFDSFKSPSAASPAIKIGKILGDCEKLQQLTNDSYISLYQK